jgi:hypothetical protein
MVQQVINDSGLKTIIAKFMNMFFASSFLTRFTRIDSNFTDCYSNIATNTSNIGTNTSNIATNTSNIGTNTSNIATNTKNIKIFGNPFGAL